MNISEEWIKKALSWADQHFTTFAFHQHNAIPYPYNGFRNLIAIGANKVINSKHHSFEEISKAWSNNWLFGYLGYDLKNEFHQLKSQLPDPLDFPDFFFFEPEYLIEIKNGEANMIIGDPDVLYQIKDHQITAERSKFTHPKAEFSKDEYIKTVHQLIDHIIEGDFYEINFCQGFFGHFEHIDLGALYDQLNALSPKPFSCLQKLNGRAIICASPERFLKKEGRQLISQPIKGTRPRGRSKAEDELLKVELRNDEKELAENMMIVDLVRNDLAMSSISGSVKVEEMFGIYSFEQVHQMISTITSILKPELHPLTAIKNTFPMGSMTGAPKRKVMELTEVYEQSKRGAFSGAAGYFQADGDFDFNVLIRSLFVNLDQKLYGFHVGSAITYDALPENEYEECFIKAKALLALLNP